ncbi:major facilitator superfamily domain-containing protein, partial [Naematelia encephala]
EISPEEDARIRRKIDMHLLPLFCTIYGLQLMDKTCMAYGSVMGFLAEDKLTLAEYSWLGSMFYFGYLVGEYPLGLALQKLPLAKVTSFNIIAWGAMLCLMSVGKNFAGLMAIRFFLGFFESSITPALTLFTSQYYKRSEQGTR